jgi:hypothetical protein
LANIFFGRFLKNSEVAQIYWLLFPQSICSVFILTKNELGYILGDFFTNSSRSPCTQSIVRRRGTNVMIWENPLLDSKPLWSHHHLVEPCTKPTYVGDYIIFQLNWCPM